MANIEHIRNIGIGESITDFFVVRRFEVRDHEGKSYLHMELGCSRGRISATYWGEDVAQIASSLVEGDVVKVHAHGTDFKGQRWLKILRMRKASEQEVSYEKLMPKGRYSPKVLQDRFSKIVQSIKHPSLSKLLQKIFVDDKRFLEKFSTYPAAKLWHGAYIGGLLEHTLRVAKICDVASTFYPDCRKEILITGALLHDIGKVDEISTEGFFDYSSRGRLIGHITLGVIKVSDAIKSIGRFQESLEDEIIHLVLSHHGTAEMGSPVEPKTLEAMILHHSDMLDAQADGVQHIVERDLPRGEKFSEYVKILGRYIYLEGYREKDRDE